MTNDPQNGYEEFERFLGANFYSGKIHGQGYKRETHNTIPISIEQIKRIFETDDMEEIRRIANSKAIQNGWDYEVDEGQGEVRFTKFDPPKQRVFRIGDKCALGLFKRKQNCDCVAFNGRTISIVKEIPPLHDECDCYIEEDGIRRSEW